MLHVDENWKGEYPRKFITVASVGEKLFSFILLGQDRNKLENCTQSFSYT